MAKVSNYEENRDNQSESSVNNKFNKKKLVIPILIVVALGMIFLLLYVFDWLSYESTDDAFIEGHIVQISPKVEGQILKVYIKDNQNVKSGDLIAEIDPKDYLVRLEQAKAALQQAIADQRAAGINIGLTSVVAGAGREQALYGIDFYRSGVQVTLDQICIAQNNYEQAQARVVQTQASVEQAIASVQSAESSRELAQHDYNRFRKLFEQGAVSRQELERTRTNLDVAIFQYTTTLKNVVNTRAAVNVAREALDAAAHVIQQTKSQLAQAQASTKQAIGKLKQSDTVSQNVAISKSQFESANAKIRNLAARVSESELDLSYTKILAPQSGNIARKSIEKGDYVKAGQVMMALVPSQVWVIANFKENQLKEMEPGQKVTIKVDAYPHKIFKGHVDSIQHGTGSRFSLFPPENAVGSYVKVVQRIPVKIVFDEAVNTFLVPGMSVIPEVKVR